MKTVIQKSLKDIFSKDTLFFVLKVSITSLLVTVMLLWYLWDNLTQFIASYLSFIPWEWLQTTGASVLSIVFSYMFFIIILSWFTSLFSEKLLVKLAKKHYPLVEHIGTTDTVTSIWLTLKASMLFLFMFLLFIPLLFVPILGQIVLLYLWSILLRKPTIYDVASLFISQKDTIQQKMKKTKILAMVASSFNYIPLLNLFAPVFAQILFLHHILGKK